MQFRFNEDRKIEQIVPVVRNDAHKMIEEFMLCANVATAGFLEKLQIPALYRIHDGPLEKKLKNLRAFLGERGLNLGGGDKPTPADYDKLLTSLGDRSDAHIIRTMMLRSLSQAEYSPDNQGHFGLAYFGVRTLHFADPSLPGPAGTPCNPFGNPPQRNRQRLPPCTETHYRQGHRSGTAGEKCATTGTD